MTKTGSHFFVTWKSSFRHKTKNSQSPRFASANVWPMESIISPKKIRAAQLVLPLD
jgi:hypothetical protein